MRRARGASVRLAFLDDQTLLAALWPALERFINGPEPTAQLHADDFDVADSGRLVTAEEELGGAEHLELRQTLRALIRRPGATRRMDPAAFRALLLRGEPVPPGEEIAQSIARAPLALGQDANGAAWVLVPPQSQRERLETFRFTVRLLSLPQLRLLLRQCDQCERFFIVERAHRRAKAFHSAACRYAYHRARRNPDAHKQYMRELRRQRRARRNRGRRFSRKESS